MSLKILYNLICICFDGIKYIHISAALQHVCVTMTVRDSYRSLKKGMKSQPQLNSDPNPGRLGCAISSIGGSRRILLTLVS